MNTLILDYGDAAQNKVAISDSDLNTITSALYAAADVYDADAVTANRANQERVARQFIEQASKARALAVKLQGN